MGFGCGGFYLDGPSVCADTLETSLRMGDWDDFNEDLDRLGVRYVIAPRSSLMGNRCQNSSAHAGRRLGP